MDDYEEILASKRAIRVLSIAAEHGELTITELIRQGSWNRNRVNTINRRKVGLIYSVLSLFFTAFARYCFV